MTLFDFSSAEVGARHRQAPEEQQRRVQQIRPLRHTKGNDFFSNLAKR
jgi:hypothetical protein